MSTSTPNFIRKNCHIYIEISKESGHDLDGMRDSTLGSSFLINLLDVKQLFHGIISQISVGLQSHVFLELTQDKLRILFKRINKLLTKNCFLCVSAKANRAFIPGSSQPYTLSFYCSI